MAASNFISLNFLLLLLPCAQNCINLGTEIFFLIIKNFFWKPPFINILELIDKTNNPPGFVIRKSSSNGSGPTCPRVKVPALTIAPIELFFNGIFFVTSANI